MVKSTDAPDTFDMFVAGVETRPSVGNWTGIIVGITVGIVVGLPVGFLVGFAVGALVGFAVGLVVGLAVENCCWGLLSENCTSTRYWSLLLNPATWTYYLIWRWNLT